VTLAICYFNEGCNTMKSLTFLAVQAAMIALFASVFYLAEKHDLRVAHERYCLNPSQHAVYCVAIRGYY
jgi:hypothetical protein